MTFTQNKYRQYESISDSIIYVAIASYRDIFLQQTIDSIFANASNPKRVRVGCFVQSTVIEIGDGTTTVTNDYDGRVKFKTVQPGSIFSVTQCRNLALSWLNDSHDFCLQIDSHTLFDAGWDMTLIGFMESLQSEKAVISSYAPKWGFSPDKQTIFEYQDSRYYDNVTYNNQFTKNAFFSTYEIVGDRVGQFSKTCLPKTWHLCGHFIFSRSTYFLHCPQPKLITFWGEELCNSIKTYTSGWDVFCPTYIPLYHYYPHIHNEELNLLIFNSEYGANRIWNDFPKYWSERKTKSTDLIIDGIANRDYRSGIFGNKRQVDGLYEILGYDIGTVLNSIKTEYAINAT
jgi:hypothetical protein